MEQLVRSVCTALAGRLHAKRGETPDNLLPPDPALVLFFCPVLFCPLSDLQEEQVSIGRLVSGAHVTVLWFWNSPGCPNKAVQPGQTGRKNAA